MTDEERRVVKNEYEKRLANHPNSDEFIAAVEAKLSPKHPPEGRICEVWMDDEPHDMSIRVANGKGRFFYLGAISGEVHKWDHYREIPTAKDALDALTDELDNDEAIYSHHEHYLAGKKAACVVVRRLIANAETG